MKYYVVADIHGYYTYLMKALQEAGFFDDHEPHKLVLCGDLLDRGVEANKLIDFMIDLMEQDMLIYISGNHEVLFFRCLQELASGGVHRIASGMSYHYQNKTWDTLLQIGNMTELEAYQYPNELISRVMNSSFYKRLLPTCLNYYETKNYIFTHGAIDTTVPDWHNPHCVRYSFVDWDALMWDDGSFFGKTIKNTDKTVVIGHFGTQTLRKMYNTGKNDETWSILTRKDGRVIALDATTCYSHKVNVLVLESEELLDVA